MPYIDVEGTPKFPGKMGGGILSFERALIFWARVFSGSAFRYLVWAQLLARAFVVDFEHGSYRFSIITQSRGSTFSMGLSPLQLYVLL